MIFRNGFVTNSSSTNYIIMSKDELTPDKLTELLGITEKSPLYREVNALCFILLGAGQDSIDEEIVEMINKYFDDKCMKEYNKFKKSGFIYAGKISDEASAIQIAFALDCYKEKRKDFYIDFSDWGY